MQTYAFRLLSRAIKPIHTQSMVTSRLLSSGSVKGYQHDKMDKKWQEYWDEHQTFVSRRRPGQPKKYILDMFPYPSGAGLHVGHPEGYTATDILSRYYRMKGFDVLHPMGWDAFGLPAEQHAINTGTHPAVTTNENIANFKRQLKSLGYSYDWTRELSTTDEDYVKWTQWIFLQLFKRGLASQSEISVNWCPALGTVLANEEIIDGLSERGGHPIVRIPLRQWVLKITDYADKLEDGLAGLSWPDGTLNAQKTWIGRSEGAIIRFPVSTDNEKFIEVFTTRPDTIMGVTYLVIAPEHPYVASLTSPQNRDAVRVYQNSVLSKSDLERTSTGKDKGKSGVFLGTHAIHPISGDKIPIWIADYVLGGYGSGAVMAVPAHDKRDYDFAKVFHLPIRQVIASPDGSELPHLNEGVVINSGSPFDGMSSQEAKDAIIKHLQSKNIGEVQLAEKKVTYRLRDWVFSRQRYWGEPIPIYFPVDLKPGVTTPVGCHSSGYTIRYDQPIAVEESALPLCLPEMSNFLPGDDPQGCLARAEDWRFFSKDGQWYARETNTMPQWAGSCWYYLRFADPKCKTGLIGKEGKAWLPVDVYVGGQEHAVLHLLYARFWHKVLHDAGVVDHSEPFTKLVHQGMILGSDGEKMSKSRGNVINPDDIVKEFGADALRMYLMFMGPLEATKPWQTSQVSGVLRFRDRVVALVDAGVHDEASSPMNDDIRREMHRAIKKVTSEIEALGFNSALSSMMIFLNALMSAYPGNATKPRVAVETLVLLLAPFAPHVAEELWQRLGHESSLAYHPWPLHDEALCVDSVVNVSVQVNGKLRGTIELGRDAVESDALREALKVASVTKAISDKPFKKIIFVPGRILNILV